MTTVSQPCRAITKSGQPCKRLAQHGADYCFAHRSLTGDVGQAAAVELDEPSAAPPPEASEVGRAAAAKPKARLSEQDLLLHELDALIQELQRQIPATSAVMRLFGRQPAPPADEEDGAPASPTLELLIQMRDSILESTLQDLLARETWQGFWLVAQVALQAQVDEAAARLDARLEIVPGYRTVRGMARAVGSALAGREPE